MDNDKNKKIILILGILTVIFTIIGGSLAYFSWISSESQKTNVVFTVERTFSCAADGGGSITNNSAIIVPTLVNNSTSSNYIKREVKVTPTINENGKTIYMDLWLDINKLDSGLSNSVNFKYAFTTSSTSNTTGVIASGNFNGKVGSTTASEMTSSNRVNLLSNKSYSATTTDTYYLWVWLDAEETSSETMDQSFSLSLNGSCGDAQPASEPELDDGMIPVVISNNGIVTTISKDNANWYNYNNKEWANVVLVNSSSRSKYLNTTGVTVNEDDILAYYVWIPRYSYRIPTVSCSTISNSTYDDYPSCYSYVLSDNDKTSLINLWQSYAAANLGSYTLEQATQDVNTGMKNGSFTVAGVGELLFTDMITFYNDIYDPDITYTTEFDSSNNFTGPREIDIVFENKTTTKQNGDAIDTYYTHPAFTFGNDELNGILVGKFETTGTADTPTVKGNDASLTGQNVSTQFTTAQKFGTSAYGSTSKVDSHMMKNSEWGAVAYLSHSKYGTNKEVRINNYSNNNEYLTGCGAIIDSEASSNTCGIVYGKAISYPQSTTGNITGVFDMSGGAREYVMGYYSGASTTWGATSNDNYAGFSSKPVSKYFDDYTTTNPLTACNGGICYGHALSEASNWYNDAQYFVYDDFPWIKRGSYMEGEDIVDSGVFSFDFGLGNGTSQNSFRSIISYID